MSANNWNKPRHGTELQDAEKPFGVPSMLPSPTKPPDHPVSITTGTVVRICLVILGVLLGAYGIYRILPVLLLLLIAIMLATAIEPVVNSLRRGPFSRSQGVLIVYSGIFAILVLIGWLVIPVFINQVGEVLGRLPTYIQKSHDWAASIHDPFLRARALDAADAINSVMPSAAPTPKTGTAAEQAASFSQAVLGLAEGALSVIIVFVVAFYWMTERTLIKRWCVSLLPADRGNRVGHVWDEIEVKVGGWVRGQLTLMGLVGLISAVGYFGLGVHYWPALALFIAVAEAIPLVGPYIGTAPAILIALVQPGNDGLPGLLNMGDFGGVLRAALVAVFAVVLQTIEGNVLVPRVMRNSVGISALAVIVSLLIGSALAGLAGAILAVPLAGAIQVVVGDLRTAAQVKAQEERRLVVDEAEKAAVSQIILPGADEGAPGYQP
ncbi:MAG TPA: AI-2E family transporter [Chloroflexia bacterium]|nr:AI-2E family transporter [Chloroflexia bacterium]